jgi:ABC-2 type transport system permease protein
VRALRRYTAVFWISFRNQWAYVLETLIRSIFLVVIMYVFSNLWMTTYSAVRHSTLSGYTVSSVVWYLAVTEAIIMGSPRLVTRLSEEIKQGDVAYRLTKPVDYVFYNYADYLGESTVRIALNLIIAGAVATLCFGGPPITFTSVWQFIVITFGALSLQFFMYMSLCLLLFWIEDGRGLELILSRCIMILGGMMIPIPMFPHWLGTICSWLPFQAVAYLPAKTFVHIGVNDYPEQLGLVYLWTLIFAGICRFLYRKGVKQLHVQGG